MDLTYKGFPQGGADGAGVRHVEECVDSIVYNTGCSQINLQNTCDSLAQLYLIITVLG